MATDKFKVNKNTFRTQNNSVLITVAVRDFSLKSATIAAFTSFQIHLTILVSITGEVYKAAFKKNKKKTDQFVI